MALLNDRAFSDLIKILEIDDPMNSNDPDRRVIEKSFRKLALKTHPDKGGDPMKFKKINDAYNRLIQHISKLEIIESDKELTTTSVIIEISKQAISKWIEKLKVYGIPRTSNFKSTLFEGPYKHYKGRSRSIGPISITLYEEPQDGIPKVHIRCENYMLWIQEQKLPLHLHVNKNKKIMFDQWRIMNVAEFGFVSSSIYSKGSCVAAYKQWSEEFESNKRSQNNEDPSEKKEQQERKRYENIQSQKTNINISKKNDEESVPTSKLLDKESHKPWWSVYSEKYKLDETTQTSEYDSKNSAVFPNVFSMTTNTYKDYSKSNSNKEKLINMASQQEKNDTENIDSVNASHANTQINSLPYSEIKKKSIQPNIFKKPSNVYLDTNNCVQSNSNSKKLESVEISKELKPNENIDISRVDDYLQTHYPAERNFNSCPQKKSRSVLLYHIDGEGG
ncbi:uncharacterized protein [Lepeophtheirus salmonis]|uniref:uncharacterized protein isoform X2 n=1 Tax=Lepeophtheirus salmonis TaxID=72036 RepID=UPI001AE2F62A|nr:uncharacterized protein LOC121127298 isoform X2 [Lepeophtheirus salmonis]